MKKLIALLLALVMLLSLVACGTKEEAADPAPETDTKTEAPKEETPKEEASKEEAPSGEKKKLVVWLPPMTDGETFDQEFWQEKFVPWEEENNCEIDLTMVPWGNFEEKFLTGFSSGDGPDVGYMYNEMMYDYIDMGQLEPLDSYLTDADKEEYTLLNLGQINGQQYTMPIFPGGMRTLYYNQDILDAAGVEKVPTIWQEFVDACLLIKEACPDVYPMVADWGGDGIGNLNNTFYPFMWAAGGELMELDGTVTLMDTEGPLQAAQFIYDLMYTYEVLPEECVGWAEPDAVQLMQDGEAAFMIYQADLYDRFADCGHNIKFTVGLGATDPDQWVAWSAADALVMNAASEEKELAWSLMKYMTSPAVMEDVHVKLCGGPTLTKSEKNLMSPELIELYSYTDHVKALPVAKNANAVMANLKSNLQLMLLGDLTPEEALQNTVDYSQTLN